VHKRPGLSLFKQTTPHDAPTDPHYSAYAAHSSAHLPVLNAHNRKLSASRASDRGGESGSMKKNQLYAENADTSTTGEEVGCIFIA
jgi:hypothetical protein